VSVVVAQSMVAVVGLAALVAPVLPGGLAALAGVGARPLALLLVNGLLSFFLAPLLYFRSLERAGLVFPPMLMTGIPVFTLLLSAAVLGLAPAPLGLLGVPLAALGGVVALAAGVREPSPA
jgi:drug/metabolite transporter (DMT)-like permease